MLDFWTYYYIVIVGFVPPLCVGTSVSVLDTTNDIYILPGIYNRNGNERSRKSVQVRCSSLSTY